MKKIKLTSEDVAQAGLEAEIEANRKALGARGKNFQRFAVIDDAVFAALVDGWKSYGDMPVLSTIAQDLGMTDQPLRNSLLRLVAAGRVIRTMKGMHGVYLPRVVKPARAP